MNFLNVKNSDYCPELFLYRFGYNRQMMNEKNGVGRIMLLTTVRSYRLEAFLTAASRLGVEIITGVDWPDELANQWPAALPLRFDDIEESTQRIVAYSETHPLSAVLAVDDSGSLLAAAAGKALGLPHNDPIAAEAARDKWVMRRRLRDSDVNVPWFRLFSTADDPSEVVALSPYPCVVKPVNLNGSRGVMRADSAEELTVAIRRLATLIGRDSAEPRPYLIEGFVPGFEVALEGILVDGVLTVLALFDKPDPLDGPFFEETIYTTPSRLPVETQKMIEETTAAAASALGLRVGPIHAEMRVNDEGVWILEIAGRSIGGLCSQILRFGVGDTLEELIVRQAAGLPLGDTHRSDRAAGVMMIPIPHGGMFRGVRGYEEASAVPLVTGIEITARENYPIVPLPEGDSYLGFIFARGETPEKVEAALRKAHSRLSFSIESLINVLPMGESIRPI